MSFSGAGKLKVALYPSIAFSSIPPSALLVDPEDLTVVERADRSFDFPKYLLSHLFHILL